MSKPTRPKLQTLKLPVRTLNTSIAGVKPLDNRAGTKVYHTSRWVNRVRPQKLQRDPLCQVCLVRDMATAANTVDHWQSIASGGDPYADSNLVSMCTPCHSAKTRCEQRGEPLPDYVPSKPRTYTIA